MYCEKPHSKPTIVIGYEQWCIVHGSQNDRMGNYVTPQQFPVEYVRVKTAPKIIEGWEH